jgi:hypothetical protein
VIVTITLGSRVGKKVVPPNFVDRSLATKTANTPLIGGEIRMIECNAKIAPSQAGRPFQPISAIFRRISDR